MKSDKASWLRVTLEVEAELAEAVAEVLSRVISSGIAIESTEIEANAEDEGRAVGPLRVSGYIPVDEELEAKRLKLERGLKALGLIQQVPMPEYSIIEDSNWMEAWKAHYRPLKVGAGLLVLPAWADVETGGRIPIRIDPGMAFGTGVHPTTQLSLALLEKEVRAGASVLDVGCGSGILSIAAAKLGAGKVVGVDIDAKAIENALHNAKLNEVDIRLEAGSLDELRNGAFGIQQADVVVANILATILMRLLAEGLADLVVAGGRLILSGILDEQRAEMLAALEGAQLRMVEERQMGDWLGLLVDRAGNR
ncbi:MAG: 50S ribosomal protein L11 methyltransferase [Chloroflexi bacterium]|nr:50S ribosomal protein L11 methyltransferase [Chloroflexota bacterium]